MRLSEILFQIKSQIKTDFKIIRHLDLLDQITIADIAIDSRLAKKHSIFFALQGKTQDGAKFINDAIKNGAAVIVTANFAEENEAAALIIQTADPFTFLVECLKIFYSPLPSNIYAITGTNGKTSTAEFTRQILEFLGKKSASIGTLGLITNANCDALQSSSLTTPDIVSLYKNMAILKKFAVDDVAIEVSSIGLEQGRIAGLEIDVGAFTNFTQDHLDYHESMEKYFSCKMILFERVLESGSFAVINSDIPEAEKIKKICQNQHHKILEYGFKAKDLRLIKIEQHDLGQKVFFEFRQKNYQFDLEISGDFQAYNALCALGNILAKYNLSEDELENLLAKFSNLNPAAGRMQRVAILKNKAQIFIDFAHSPDALINVSQLARKITKSRVLVLFGCGGNRDAKKRPIMGKIACDLADFVIVTDDNPRNEMPEAIRAEIMQACDQSKTVEISNRKAAIEKAITMLQDGDVLILAGKGHEKYQIIGETKFDFDEEKIVKNAIIQ